VSVTPSARNAEKVGVVGFLFAHRAAGATVLVAVVATAGTFVFAAPQGERGTTSFGPPDRDLPYRVARYGPQETRRAFAAAGLPLVTRSRGRAMTDLGTRDLGLEVTVFGDPDVVQAEGSFDYTLDANAKWVHFPHSCRRGINAAARWVGNVRAIAYCDEHRTVSMRTVAAALAALRAG
jgi:hypothetical protein